MEEEGVISGDWRTRIDEYVEQVRVAGAALGTHVMDEQPGLLDFRLKCVS